MDLIARQQIARRVDAALEGEEYSVIEMAYDLQRLATHPVWKQAESCAAKLEEAVALLVESLENEDVLLMEDPNRPISDWSARVRALTNHPDPRGSDGIVRP